MADLLERAISDEAPAVLHEGRLIKKGFNPELDELTTLQRDARAYLARIEAEEREKTKINSLKIGYNQVFGYYIEVTKPHLHLVPEYFQRRQTLVNAERFITPELKELEAKILTAEDRIIELNYELFCRTREEVAAKAQEIRRDARELGRLDAMLSLAEVAAQHGYNRPVVDQGDVIEIKAGRHPVIEALRPGENFIPNDIRLDSSDHQILDHHRAEHGGQVNRAAPGRSDRSARPDRVVCARGVRADRRGGPDFHEGGRVRCARARAFHLHGGDDRDRANPALCHVLKAWCCWTRSEGAPAPMTASPLPGPWSNICTTRPDTKPRHLFATHYHELVDLEQMKARVKNFHIAVKEWEGEVIFIRKLVRGGTSRSYGIQVARLSGIPEPVISRAKEILANLEMKEFDKNGKPAISRSKNMKPESNIQQMLFASDDPELAAIRKELQDLEPETLSPLEALNLIWKWRKKIKD